MVHRGKLVMRILRLLWTQGYLQGLGMGSLLDALWGIKGPTTEQQCGLKAHELKTEKLWAKRLFPLYVVILRSCSSPTQSTFLLPMI